MPQQKNLILKYIRQICKYNKTLKEADKLN